MKRVISTLLTLIMLLCCLGCQREKDTVTLYFYYPRYEYGYNEQEGMFFRESALAEIREDITYQSARQVLNEYLKGPVDPAMANPFPADLQLISLSIYENKLYLTVTDQLSELTGIPLVMACACLGKTAMQLTKVQQVQIRCESALLDGEKTINLTMDSFIFDETIHQNNGQ